MKKRLKKALALVAFVVAATQSQAIQVKNIDRGVSEASIINNKANILTFPFLVADAKLATENAEDFKIKAKRDTIIIIPTATNNKPVADLIVWSEDGYTYLIKVDLSGIDQIWKYTSNRTKPETEKTISFESGKIDKDVKKLIRSAATKKNIPGYKRTKVKRQFDTKDLTMQKDYIFNGAKYRVEKWFIKNKTDQYILLDEGAFYTKGILAISFETPKIPPHKIITMYIIVNKASLTEE